jgi:hypothetical protein
MKPVIQQDRTGCAIASVAVLTRQDYRTVRNAATKLGIEVTDSTLWSDTKHVGHLLRHFSLAAGQPETFTTWDALPDQALLAIKWHEDRNGPAWHWVVFVRHTAGSCVFDSKSTLRRHRRTDFGRMKPKWFMRVRVNADPLMVVPADSLVNKRGENRDRRGSF